MYEIVRPGGKARLRADAILTPADFVRIGEELGETPVRARKVGDIAARRTTKRERIETRWNGKETINTARSGDFIVTNLTARQQPLRDQEGRENIYVIAADKFAELYEATTESNAFGMIYRAKGIVSGLSLPGGFDIVAPWGERQTGASGYLLLNGDEVYGISRGAFDDTYDFVQETSGS